MTWDINVTVGEIQNTFAVEQIKRPLLNYFILNIQSFRKFLSANLLMKIWMYVIYIYIG